MASPMSVLIPLFVLLIAVPCSSYDPSVVVADDLAGAGMCMLQRKPAERMPPGARMKLESSLSSSARPELLQEHKRKDSSNGRCRHVGGRAWLSQKGVDYLIEAFKPVIIDEIEALQISPKVGSQYGFNYRLTNFVISNLTIDSPKATFSEGEGLTFDIQGVSVAVKVKYSVEGTDWWNPLWTSGTVNAKVAKNTGGIGSIKVGVSPLGTPVLNMTVDTLKTKLQDLEITGTSLGPVIEFLSGFAEGLIEEAIAEKIKSVIEWFVNAELNSYLDVLDLRIPVPLEAPYNISALDLSLCSVQVGSNYIGVGIRGEVTDIEDAGLVYPVEPRDLPVAPPMADNDFESSMVAVALTPWSINSGLWLYQQRGLATYTLMQNNIPPNSPISLNAEYLRPLMKNGFGPSWYWGSKKYNKKQEFDIKISSNDVPTIDFKPGTIQTTINTTMAFEVMGVPSAEQYAFSIQVPIGASADLSVKDNKVVGELHYVSSLPIKLINAAGQVSMFAVSAFVQLLSTTVLVPLANMELSEGFPIPSKYGVTAHNTSVEVTDLFLLHSDVQLDTDEIMRIIMGEEDVDETCPPACVDCEAAYDEFGERRMSGDTPLIFCHTKDMMKDLSNGCAYVGEEEFGFRYICHSTPAA